MLGGAGQFVLLHVDLAGKGRVVLECKGEIGGGCLVCLSVIDQCPSRLT